MSEERKVLLSLKDVEVKFNVRGRVLTAIRGVTFDIYENESLAIVGESGSGKSVLTKTFTGMLESNGFISNGSVIFQDDQLSQINKTLSSFDIRRYKKLVAFLDNCSRYVAGKEVYREMLKEKENLKNLSTLTKEEILGFETIKKELQYDRVELYNQQMVVSNSDEKKEIINKIKAIDIEIKALDKERKDFAKHKKNSVYENDEFMLAYKDRMDKLNEQYQKLISISIVDEQTKIQNRLFAKEILLSIERYSFITQFFYLNSLKDRFEEAYKRGVDFNDDDIEKIYRLITFRVVYQGADNQYFAKLDEQESEKLALENKELFTKVNQNEVYKVVKEFASTVKANEKFVNYVATRLIESNDYDNLTFKLHDFYEEVVMTKDSTIKGYTILDLTKITTASDWQKIRGSRIATVFQDPMTSLNPIVTIGKQITEVILKHQNCSIAEAEKRAIAMMERVGIPNAAKRFNEYPFQYSGGMRQRIVIAIALSCQPKVLICDEPTTALDVTIQAQIIELIKDLQKEFKFTTVYITHDLGVVASVADRVAVLYAGQIVEAGLVEEIFYDPRHPYTWALLSSLPQLAQKGKELFSIHGTPPSLYNVIKGDAFAERNPYCLAVDLEYEPPYFYVSDTHFAKTWLLDPRAPKIEKPEIIQDIHQKLEKTQVQFDKEDYEYARYNRKRSNLINTKYRHRISKR